MRPTRLIYVENDPALRGILARLLDKHPDIELLLHTDTPGAALHRGLVESADVALLDLALGSDEMNGIDLGLAMRRLNENIGIVIHSQYRLDTVARSVPPEVLFGWSALPKSGEMPIEEIVDVVRGTARGRSFGIEGNPDTESPLQVLTMRQRAVMGMTASGIKATEIARRVGGDTGDGAPGSVEVLPVLVPEAGDEIDLRTKAILVYHDLIRDDDADDGT